MEQRPQSQLSLKPISVVGQGQGQGQGAGAAPRRVSFAAQAEVIPPATPAPSGQPSPVGTLLPGAHALVHGLSSLRLV